MKNINMNNGIVLNSGIYFNSKSTRSCITDHTRPRTIKKKISRKIRDNHYLEDKIKIAFSVFVIVTILAKFLIG